DPSLLDGLRALHQAQRILGAVADGVAVVDFDLRVRWANPTFDAWCGGPAPGRGFYEALGSPPGVGPGGCPFPPASPRLSTRRAAPESPEGSPGAPGAVPASVGTRLLCRGNRHIDLRITPLYDQESPLPAPSTNGDSGGAPLFIALGRDVTLMVQQ